jgi:uncharacterized protein (TIGR02270 family)
MPEDAMQCLTETPVLARILSQHAEQAAFLWLLRHGAGGAAQTALGDLCALDERLDAHLDGLRVAGDGGWRFCVAGLTHQEPGEVFAAAVVALERGVAAPIDRVLDCVEQAPQTQAGFVSALGWLSAQPFMQRATALLASPSALWRRIGIAGHAIQRIDCGARLGQALTDPDPHLRRRAARAAGELARVDLRADLAAAVGDQDPGTRVWAAWSLALLGDWQQAIGPLAATLQSPGPERGRAVQIVARIVAPQDFRHWFEGLPVDLESRRLYLVGLGAGGDPAAIPWLIECMADSPPLARGAGAALRLITGLDVAAAGMDRPPPAGFVAGPSDDPADDQVALDPDAGLPWPDGERVAAWWRDHASDYRPAARYLSARPVSADHCWALLHTGRQQERMAAALELALMEPAQPLFETRAPAWRQAAWLAARAVGG